MIAVALGTVLVGLGATSAQALEFERKGRGLIGSGLSYLLPIPSRGEVRPEAKALDKKQVEEINKGKVDLPRCVSPEGSLRIVEPDDGQSLWASYGLPMPTRMLRSFVTESSCWMVLDRGVGFAAAQAERELASGGHLQSGSNLGGGQMLAADYILIPDIVSQNSNAGGRNIGGGGGGSAGGLGRFMLGGGGSSQRKTVSVMLTLVDSRTSEVLATSTGAAEVSDRQWQIMASGAGSNGMASGHGNISAGAYENTEIGTVTRAAYHQAFHQMLFDLEPMDLRARIQAAPEATRQQQPAQAAAYSTGGSPTMTTSGAPAQMQIDQHAAHAQVRTQQMQQLHQMHQMHQQHQQPQQQMQQMQYQQQQPQQMQYQQQPQQQMQPMQYQQQPMQAVGMTANGMAPANLAQVATQQMAGQMLPAGSAQLVGAVANGLQQGNLGQMAQQVAAQALAPTGQVASGVLILKVPANFMADAGNTAVLRVLQPGETVARLAFSAQGDMLQVRDSRGNIGWIAADTIADVINAQ